MQAKSNSEGMHTPFVDRTSILIDVRFARYRPAWLDMPKISIINDTIRSKEFTNQRLLQ